MMLSKYGTNELGNECCGTHRMDIRGTPIYIPGEGEKCVNVTVMLLLKKLWPKKEIVQKEKEKLT